SPAPNAVGHGGDLHWMLAAHACLVENSTRAMEVVSQCSRCPDGRLRSADGAADGLHIVGGREIPGTGRVAFDASHSLAPVMVGEAGHGYRIIPVVGIDIARLPEHLDAIGQGSSKGSPLYSHRWWLCGHCLGGRDVVRRVWIELLVRLLFGQHRARHRD